MKYFIKTFGCQMNEAESEKIAAALEKKGYRPAKNISDADLVVIDSCSVRQSAEDRVIGLVNNLKKLKIKNCKLKIILTGCMLYHSGKWLRRKLPAVDEFIKTEDLVCNSKLAIRNSKTQAWVPIMKGCNQFCAYCVVPYSRGREKSRPFEEIVCEVERLAERGYKQITLLGQNVNSYQAKAEFKIQDSNLQFKTQNLKRKYKNDFALLLSVLNEIEGIEKISFISSNPWDLTTDIIKAMKLPKIDRYLHLAVQSGDDEILKRMNRPYTADQYFKLIKKIRALIPDIKIGTDIIVGFPGESEKAFENTVKLCQKVGFEKAYIAIYSPRPGTAAYKMEDNVPYKEKRRRWRILNTLINRSG